MKKRKNQKGAEVYEVSVHIDACIILLAAMLLCGAVAGCITASYVTGDAGQALNEYINKYISFAGAEITIKELLPDAIFNLYKYPLIAFLFGYTVFGIILIPAVVFFRGFFLSFSVASVVHVFGYKGLVAALSVYGLQALVTIPCTLIISAQAMRASRGFFSLTKTGKEWRLKSPVPAGYFTCFIICAAVLLVCAILEVFLVPKFVSWAASLII